MLCLGATLLLLSGIALIPGMISRGGGPGVLSRWRLISRWREVATAMR